MKTIDNLNIYLFKTAGNYYLYDVSINKIAAISNEIYSLLEETGSDLPLKTTDSYELKRLLKNSYLSGKKVHNIENKSMEFAEDILTNKINKITLQVTQECNFRCKYCVYSGGYLNRTHSPKNMDWSMARKGIDFLYAHSRDSRVVYLGFYGGEPLLRYDLIEKSISYANSLFEGKHLNFTITTNGSLLTKKMIEFFLKNDVKITISLDGPAEIQDKNRKFASNDRGTFNTVYNNIKSILHEFPEYQKI